MNLVLYPCSTEQKLLALDNKWKEHRASEDERHCARSLQNLVSREGSLLITRSNNEIFPPTSVLLYALAVLFHRNEYLFSHEWGEIDSWFLNYEHNKEGRISDNTRWRSIGVIIPNEQWIIIELCMPYLPDFYHLQLLYVNSVAPSEYPWLSVYLAAYISSLKSRRLQHVSPPLWPCV